jgi:hypothetical protein
MKPEFVNVVLVLAYFVAGSAGIALLVGWALKRFGSPGQPSSKSRAPKSKEQDCRKAGNVSTPRSDHERARQ